MAPLYATTPEIQDGIRRAASVLREKGALVHCITNYVTVENCANAVLAVGASPHPNLLNPYGVEIQFFKSCKDDIK